MMKVVSCVQGQVLSIIVLYGRISQGLEWQQFTMWRMLLVQVCLSSTHELS